MDQENNENLDRRDMEKRRFQFDAGINIAHIITTLGMVFALFNWGSGVNSAQAIATMEIQNIKHDREVSRAEMTLALQEINRKLDKLAERSNHK
jgi:cellobiose-specific phosphotransferase system component IIC